ncbi:MarR family transcriptional regulator [Paenibacillus sp. YN15]|nr:MarR family transcriptional regulator [Paenibacillus sp. YN15]
MNHQSLEEVELELALLIRRLTSMVTAQKVGSLDRAAYLLLTQISLGGACSVKTLSQTFHLDISTVSRQVSSLEQKGYVRRVPDELDGRAFILSITGLGEQLLADDKANRIARLGHVLDNWEEGEMKQFGQLLRKFNHSVVEAEQMEKVSQHDG